MDESRKNIPDRKRAFPPVLYVYLFSAVALAFLLSTLRLGSQSLWTDEALTWWLSSMPLEDLINTIQIDGVTVPLYFLLTKAVTMAGEPSEAALRLPSTLAYSLTVVPIFLIGYRLGGLAGALAGVWFWLLHPMALWYGRDARPYALAALFAAVLLLWFLHLKTSWRRGLAILAALTMVFGLLTHYFFFLLIAGLTLLAVTEIRSRPAFFRRWTLLVLISLVPSALWLLGFLSQPSPSLGMGWIGTPGLADLPLTVLNLASGYGGALELQNLLFALVVVSFVAIAAAGDRLYIRLLVFALLVPIGAVWLLSLRRAVYMDRYMIVLLPVVAALVAGGASRTWRWMSRSGRPRRRFAISLVGGAALFLLGLISVRSVYSDARYAKETWRELSVVLNEAGIGSGGLWLSEAESGLPLRYYGIELPASALVQSVEDCAPECFLLQRQPYTPTHAFTQSLSEPGRPWIAAPPENCTPLEVWETTTGLALWRIACEVDESF